MKHIFNFTLCTYILGITLAGTQGPQKILDSDAYQIPKNLDNMHMFLGQIVPKHLFIMLSEKDKDLTVRLLEQALETSPSFLDHKWSNIDNQHKGSILVYPAETINGYTCRKFLVRFYINDEKYELRGESCRVNGVWIAIESQ